MIDDMTAGVSAAMAAGPGEPIAIIGMSCRLPGADACDALWQLLRDGTDAITEAPAGRWPEATPGPYRRGGFVSDIEGFDADFFGISPNEAAAADPQQRLTLELAWEALEHARIIPADLHGTAAGVFVGAAASDFAALQDRRGAASMGPHSYTGSHRAIIANRISYVLRLRGPSLTLDTGQSSSLVAVQLACESLRRGESSIALAGGVNLNLLAETTAAIGRLGALSPDGRCRVFDRGANGYVRGEGGALIVLKPLSAARRDGDVVHSVILGGAVNNDGGGDGLTVPSVQAQEQLLRQACARAGVRPADVQYVELHGTGTRAGDPVEAAALGAALGHGRPAAQPLLVGSVKTNVGHLEGAAGIAGLLKVALSISHGELPASLHFAAPNPAIDLDVLRLEVVTAGRGWPAPDRAPVAGVSSFGMGGTNCHLLLGPAPAVKPDPATSVSATPVRAGRDVPWVLSARSAASLAVQAQRLSAHLDQHPGADPGTVALTLATTRTAFEHRAVILGQDRRAGLAALAAGQPDPGVLTGTAITGRRVFTFPGQGSQWPEMARDLLKESAGFAEGIEACAAALAPFTDYSLLDVLRGVEGAPDLSRVDVVQPALWAVMVSLAGLWRASGVSPEIVIGHSQGEIAAATVAGALSLSDGARVAALRSRAIAGIAGGGGMLSVAARVREVEEAIGAVAPRTAVAAVNGPRSVVVSGAAADLAALDRHLTAAGYQTKIIPVGYASHSPAVEQVRDEILGMLAPVRPVTSGIAFISALTGELMDTAALDAQYWYRSLRRPVRFGTAARAALELGGGLFVECSPHPVLVTAVEETIEEAGQAARAVGTLRREHGGMSQFRRALAEAYVGGAAADWVGQPEPSHSALTDLPTYAFSRRRYPLTGLGSAAVSAPAPAVAGARSRRELRDLVLNTTAGALGHQDASDIVPGRTFKDLGVDSATAIELRSRLKSALPGLALPASLVFDYPTPEELAARLYALTGQDQPDTRGAQAPRAAGRHGPDDDPIAIIGIGCRYPGGVTSPEDLWKLLTGGTDAITEFPVNRGWDLDALLAGPDRPGASSTRHGGFLHDADQFDAAFFGVSPREAAAMDPQQRLMLEICWEAAERGDINPHTLRGTRTGVFVGAMAPEYGPRLHRPTGNADGHRLTGTAMSVISGRIAYAFGLHGPAITVDTACSSSLVAIHLAAQALRRCECTLALAGGVTVMASPGIFVEFSRQHGLAADGRCKAFSADADGTGWAEGAGVLLLERLSDARRNGHRILALVLGSAVNQDGRSNGLTAPNGPAQERVIADALADAGLSPGDVHAVEAHGTGTTLGDPVEAGALIAAYGRGQAEDQPVWLGSAKSNIGHTQAAAGVAGVIKMTMAIRHGLLPATLHVTEPTLHVDWSAGRVRLLTQAVPWPAGRGPAVAGISGFGVSGTNAHVLIGQPPEHDRAQPASSPDGPLLWVLSARTETALRSYATGLHDFAQHAADADLAAAGPALRGRARFARRAVVLAGDRDDLLAALTAIASGSPHACVTEGAAADDVQPVFVFPGQGSQWAGMAAELMESHQGFRAELLRCAEAFAPYTGWSVLDVLRGCDGAPPLAGSDVIQPVLFAVMVSLAAVWRAAGVRPAAVIGHSQGEIAAAYVAGALTLPDAARIVALRSKALMKLTGTGGMLALPVPAGQAADMLAPWPDRLWVAIHSGPEATVIAGDLDALDEFAAAHGAKQRIHRVAIDYAAHTPHIEVLRDELLAILDGVTPRQADVGICSSLTGELIDPAELTADYWFRGLRHPVRFTQAVTSLAGPGTPLFIEVSPHPVLTGYISDTLHAAAAPGGAVASLRRGSGGLRQLLTAAAQAFVLGADVDWQALMSPAMTEPALADPALADPALADPVVADPVVADPASARPAELPGYPFERRRFWLSDEPGPASAASSGMTASRHPLLLASAPLGGTGGYLLTGRLDRGSTRWLTDHEVDGTVLLPGTAFVELALQAAAAAGCDLVEELIIEAPAVLQETGTVQVQLLVSGPDPAGRRSLAVHLRAAGDPAAAWARHASGTLAAASVPSAGPQHAGPAGAWPPAGSIPVDLSHLYERLANHGYGYGPAFQGLTKAWRLGEDAYVEVALPEPARPDAARFTLHPALLDAALHYIVLMHVSGTVPGGELLLPFSWNGVRVAAPGAEALRVRITRLADGQVSLTGLDTTGRPVADVTALTLRQVPASRPAAQPGLVLYTVEWTGVAASEAGPSGQPLSGQSLSGQHWAVIGCDSRADQLAADLGVAGADAGLYYDLPSVAEMTGGDLPATIIASCGTSDRADVPAALREAAGAALDLVQAWLGDERFADRRLVLVTQGAFGAAAPSPGRLAAAAIWGLVRSAQREHPSRFALVDLAGDCPAPLLAAAVATDEPQLLIEHGTLRVPRLTPQVPVPPAGRAAGPSDGSVRLADGTILVTGGTGGLGALVAQRLAQRHGVRHLLLVSSRGPDAPGAADLSSRLRELGAEVTIAACDVSDRAALAALLARIPAGRPLAGVVHAAGRLDDATVEGLSARHLETVLGPKADAAWHLHELTAGLPLTMFVLFSSVAGLLGAPGQANYAAANAVLDALATGRRQAGQPAVSIAWGPWDTSAGMTSDLTAPDLARMARAGLAPLASEPGLELFDAALAAAGPLAVAARWDDASLSEAGDGMVSPLLRGILTARPGAARRPATNGSAGHRHPAAPAAGAAPANGAGPASDSHGDLAARLAALATDDARRLLVDLVRSHVAAVLAYPSPDAVDVERAVSDLGFDSLTAVELRNRLDEATGLRLSATLAFDHPTVSALAEHLHRVLDPAPPPAEDTLRAAIEEVQRAWPEPDGLTRGKITAILHSALARWGSGPRPSPEVQGQIDTASDDEIFAFIDNEI
jgi:acyl transferase domain-containing protein/NADP-dependent 3-hydroxy acid dehydrogenase YdfG